MSEELVKTLEDSKNCMDIAFKFYFYHYSAVLPPAMYHTWKAASDDGNLLALALISECQFFGEGVQKNTEDAAEARSRFLDLAEEAKSEEYEVLECSDILYFRGYFCVVYDGEEEKGAQYISESMDLGNADATYYLSILTYIGHGVEKDLEKAVELVGIAMRRGSMSFFSNFLRLVTEIESDIEKIRAIDWGSESFWEKLQGTKILSADEMKFLALSVAGMYKFQASIKQHEGHMEEAQRYLETADVIKQHWGVMVQTDTKVTPRQAKKPSILLDVFRRFS